MQAAAARDPESDPAAESVTTPDSPSSPRFGAFLAGLLGLVCFAVYWWIEGLLPRGPEEFSYFPFMTDPLPFAPMRGFTFEQLVRHLGRTFVLGPSLACLAWALWIAWKAKSPGPRHHRLLLIAAIGLSVVTTAYVMAVVLQGRAIVDDELVYRQQAELLADGRLAENSVPPWGFEVFTIWTRLGATGKYLFGEPIVQIIGTIIGLPAFLHLFLAPLALWAWFRVVRTDAGRDVALWATLLIAVSPMFILTNALALSHTTTLTCLILAGLGFQWARDDRPLSGALLTGLALGFGLAVRPQVVVPMGAVIGFATLYQLIRRKHIAAAATLVVSGSFWLVLIGLYNKVLTGSALKLPWYFFYPIERFGFGDVGGVAFIHTPWTAVENLLVVIVQFNNWWLGWPLSFAPILLWLVLCREHRQGLGLWLWGTAAILLLNIPYYSTGISETGPIYNFELLLPASLLGAHAIVYALSRWPSATCAVLIVHFTLGTLTFLGENVSRLDRLVTTIHASTEELLSRLELPALLLHESAWTESMRFGWVWSFPVRNRHEQDAIITYPRPPEKYLDAMLRRFQYRACYYYRLNPETAVPELYSCQDALGLMRQKRGRGTALRLNSTAERLGFLDLEEAYFGRKRSEDPPADTSGQGE